MHAFHNAELQQGRFQIRDVVPMSPDGMAAPGRPVSHVAARVQEEDEYLIPIVQDGKLVP